MKCKYCKKEMIEIQFDDIIGFELHECVNCNSTAILNGHNYEEYEWIEGGN